jgi:hypothetical protein
MACYTFLVKAGIARSHVLSSLLSGQQKKKIFPPQVKETASKIKYDLPFPQEPVDHEPREDHFTHSLTLAPFGRGFEVFR